MITHFDEIPSSADSTKANFLKLLVLNVSNMNLVVMTFGCIQFPAAINAKMEMMLIGTATYSL